MTQRASIGSLPATYAYFAGLLATAMLVGANLAAPGCTGPRSPAPCDFVAIAKVEAEPFNPYSPYSRIQVLDRGSSAYVHERDRSHGPGVLIDKASCRVCEAHAYSDALPDFLLEPGQSNGRVLYSAPSERPVSEGPWDIYDTRPPA